MSITAEAPKRDNSPWFDLMENKAIAWNQFAEENNFEFDGLYNHYHVVFEGNMPSHFGGINIVGFRKLVNVSGGLLGKSAFSEQLKIEFSARDKNLFSKIKLFKKGIINWVFSVFYSSEFTVKTKHYTIKFSDKLVYERLAKTGIFSLENIGIFNCQPDSILLKIYGLPESKKELSVINQFLAEIKKMTTYL